MRQNRPDDALSEQLIQVHVQPGFFLRTESHGFCLDWSGIVQAELVMIPRIPYFADICLLRG